MAPDRGLLCRTLLGVHCCGRLLNPGLALPAQRCGGNPALQVRGGLVLYGRAEPDAAASARWVLHPDGLAGDPTAPSAGARLHQGTHVAAAPRPRTIQPARSPVCGLRGAGGDLLVALDLPGHPVLAPPAEPGGHSALGDARVLGEGDRRRRRGGDSRSAQHAAGPAALALRQNPGKGARRRQGGHPYDPPPRSDAAARVTRFPGNRAAGWPRPARAGRPGA